MFLQQTDEMLLCYNVFPLHHPMERFCEQNQKMIRINMKENIKIQGTESGLLQLHKDLSNKLHNSKATNTLSTELAV